MYIILVASLNENMKLAKLLQEELQSLGYESRIMNLVEQHIPLYDSNKEEQEGIPKQMEKLLEVMQSSKGYIVVAPEYNYSIPPVLTNAIAWASRVGSDFREYFSDKPILLATHSGGGGQNVVEAMRKQFSGLGSQVMDDSIVTNYHSKADTQSIQKVIAGFVQSHT